MPANCAVELIAAVMRRRRDAAVESFKSNFCLDIQVCDVSSFVFPMTVVVCVRDLYVFILHPLNSGIISQDD